MSEVHFSLFTYLRSALPGLGLLASLSLSVCSEKTAPARPNTLFCLSDDQSYPHASAYGEPVIKTPVFDRVAREEVLFTQAYCAAPSCTPSRSAILTGHSVYTDLLREAGHSVVHSDVLPPRSHPILTKIYCRLTFSYYLCHV